MLEKITNNVYVSLPVEFGSNVYIILNDTKNKAILIDTTTKENKDYFVSDLEELNLTPKDIEKVILTHKHYDHIELLPIFDNADILSSDSFEDKQELSYDSFNLQIFKTPGHSSDSICILDKKNKILYSGDTIFSDGNIGRTDLETGNFEKVKESIKLLKTLEFDLICSGHGIPLKKDKNYWMMIDRLIEHFSRY